MAISRDSSAKSSVIAPNALSASLTVSGTNRIIFVAVGSNNNTNTVTGVTYNGVACTKIGSTVTIPTSTGYVELWYLLNPATGANTLAVTYSNSSNAGIGFVAASYKAVLQASTLDQSTTNTTNNGTSVACTVTTTVDADWGIAAVKTQGNGSNPGANTTQVDSQGTVALYEAGPKTPAGSLTLTATTGSGDFFAMSMTTFKPDGVAVTASVLDTVTLTDTEAHQRYATASVTDTVTPTDDVSSRLGFKNPSKSSSTWSNTDKS